MKIFKLFLVLALLIAMSFTVSGQPDTLELTDVSHWEPTTDWIKVCIGEPETLLGWFENLTLDEKVAVYNWWKNDSVTIKSFFDK